MSDPRKTLVEGLAEWWHLARHEASGDAGAPTPDGLPVLLERKLAALGLSPKDIETWSPALLDDLKRNCRDCPDRQRCMDDMAIDPLAPGWESYCPNSGTLASL